MFKPKMIEKENNFICQNKHELPIHLVVLDPKLDKKQRFLCTLCLENFESEFKTIGFKKIIQIIQEQQEIRMKVFESLTQEIIQKLEKCIAGAQQLKTFFIKMFDSIIRICEDWTQNLVQQEKQSCQYSFYDELDNFIKNINVSDFANKKLIDNINKSWMTKLHNNIILHSKDKNILQFNELKQQFINIFNKKQPQEDLIKFKLIDQTTKQVVQCSAIVFDSSGSIMVSNEGNNIKVWSFIDGTIKLKSILTGHTDWILCLIYSQKQNSFISGSLDKKLRCWKQFNQDEWKSSQPYSKHTNYVKCMTMNQKEDLLFSGSDDQSIIVWSIDFNLNQLTFLYSLQKHNNYVVAISLNPSENLLVSCARGKDQIIIWERFQQNHFQFSYCVKQSINNFGFKIKFINDNQFIWASGDEQIDELYVFELKEDIFQENLEKTLQLVANNKILDEYRFPIVYNKERNLIVLRHKTFIYLIRIMNDGTFKIDHQSNCVTLHGIYGTVSTNGKYVVYWDEKNQGYLIYEL